MDKISERIQALEKIRDSYLESFVVLPNEEIESGFNKYVTIDNSKCQQIYMFGKYLKKEKQQSSETIKIKGNYFGPFMPEKFLEQEIRIVALLKEDYIENDSFYFKKDRGGHIKSKDFGANNYTENATYRNLSQILNAIIGVDNPESTDFIEHTAIININPFPGLSIKKRSKESFVTDSVDKGSPILKFWAKESKEMIIKQLALLEPTIVLSGNVLRYYLSTPNLFELVRNNRLTPQNFGTVFNRRICNAKIAAAFPDVGIYVDEHKTIWIDDNHPSYIRDLETHAQIIAEAVKLSPSCIAG